MMLPNKLMHCWNFLPESETLDEVLDIKAATCIFTHLLQSVYKEMDQ